jgi:hypothetical protein
MSGASRFGNRAQQADQRHADAVLWLLHFRAPKAPTHLFAICPCQQMAKTIATFYCNKLPPSDSEEGLKSTAKSSSDCTSKVSFQIARPELGIFPC